MLLVVSCGFRSVFIVFCSFFVLLGLFLVVLGQRLCGGREGLVMHYFGMFACLLLWVPYCIKGDFDVLLMCLGC